MEAPTPRGRSPRSGATLPMIAMLLLIVGAGIFMLHRTVMQRFREAHRLSDGEVAIQLAESGLNVGLERLMDAALDPGSELFRKVVEASPAQLDGLEHRLEVPPLEDLAAVVGPEARVEVVLRFEGFRPFASAGTTRGVAVDPAEKYGLVVTEARAQVRDTVRSLRASRQAKVVHPLAPVLSKFTLFVRGQEGREPNLLGYDREAPGKALTDGQGKEARPVVLFHHPEVLPVLSEGRFLPLATVLEDRAPDAGGLVFLGGEEPWYLNLVHGAGSGPFEELHLLRRARYLFPSALPGVDQEVGLHFGFYQGVLDSPALGPRGADGRVVRPTGEPVTDRTSALHLYGDLGNVSPTIVLGPAMRAHLTVRLPDGILYPFLTEGEYRDMPVVPPVDGGYEPYRTVMARVHHEAYNRSYDYLVTNHETLTPEGTVSGGEDDAFVPAHQLTRDRLTVLGPVGGEVADLAYPEPGAPAPAPITLHRPGPGGAVEPLFRGLLADLDGDLLETLLLAKVVERVPDGPTLLQRYTRAGRLELPGIVLVERGPLELGQVAIGRAGLVLVPQDVVVTDWIRRTAEAQPLTLVSLAGNVEVRTGQTVQAHLVALRGSFRSAGGQLHVLGGVAAAALDLPALVRGPEPKWIQFDPALDPTVASNHRSQLRLFLDERVAFEITGH